MGHHFLNAEFVNFDIQWLKMKNKATSTLLWGSIFLLFFGACDRSPQVYSVNNFGSGFEENGKVSAVLPLPVKGLTGLWLGLEHKLKISSFVSSDLSDNGKIPIKDTVFFKVELIDTIQENGGLRDTTQFYLDFISIAGHQYIEVFSPGTKIAAHDFMLPISTYLKINKLTRDTIIIQMLDGNFTESFLKSKGFDFFIPYDYNKEKSGPIYITENPERLAQVLKAIYAIPEAFQRPDTLVRIR